MVVKRGKATRVGLEAIPGIGPALAAKLERIGVQAVSDLCGADPQALYDRLAALEAAPVDRCVLYTFRCAVYFASNTQHDPDKLKWWTWQDKQAASKRRRP